jgi:phosphoglycolate phosphatase
MSRVILDGLGVTSYFVAIVGGDSLPTRKPDPAGLALLARTSATPSARMLLVGDSGVDVATAANGGVDFCGVAWGLDPDGLRATGPARVVESPDELVVLVAGDHHTRGARARSSS